VAFNQTETQVVSINYSEADTHAATPVSGAWIIHRPYKPCLPARAMYSAI